MTVYTQKIERLEALAKGYQRAAAALVEESQDAYEPMTATEVARLRRNCDITNRALCAVIAVAEENDRNDSPAVAPDTPVPQWSDTVKAEPCMICAPGIELSDGGAS